ncbi:hypothetical protein V498_04832 [Pseudogymnoascus sp. VKM F-4517 (FW-2822)]|nr:hypothetical protein V498_04832 [Pseudogymnoascus sp. VKM F-4517 (FW-2822)]
MLFEYKKLALAQPVTLKQPWAFTAKVGDVRCIRHIINIAVQAALASLKATLDKGLEAYRLKIREAQIPLTSKNDIGSSYPTLNYAVLQYMRMIKKLEDMRHVMDSIEAKDLAIEQAININIDSEDELYVLQSRYDIEPEWKQWMKEPTVSRDTDILKYLLYLRNWGVLSQGNDEDSGDDADNES